MRILVADDEFYARKAVIQMIEDWDSTVEIVEAEDGNAALGIIQTQKPDVLLTDIRMPGFDGIELAAHIHKNHIDIFVIIISGYDDFAYAQQAIRYKVENYLLKPMDRQELYPILEQLKKHTSISLESEREAALAELLYKTSSQSSDSSHAAFQLQSDRYQLAVLWVQPDQRKELALFVKEFLNRHGRKGIVSEDAPYSQLLIIWLNCEHNSIEGIHDLGTICDSILRQFEGTSLENDAEDKQQRVMLAAGVSSMHAHMDQLQAAYKEAKMAVLQSVIIGSKETISNDELGSRFHYDATIIYDWTEAFNRKIAHHQTQDAIQMIEQWIASAEKQKYSAYMVKDWFATTVKTMNAFIEKMNANSTITFIEQHSLFEYVAIQDAYYELVDQLHELSELLKASEEKLDMVQSIMDYVETHYKSRILLDDLAHNKYYVDPSYLSRLFKRKSGMGFQNYLQTVRMEKARHMLEKGTEMSVSEVASEVGFNDYSYFIQTYRKYFGETPGKFKNSKSANESK